MKVNTHLMAASLEIAFQHLQADSKNQILAGGAWLKLTAKEVPVLIDLSQLALEGIHETKESIEIGAMTTLRSLEKYEFFQTFYNGILPKAIGQIMGVGVRNLATIGGSIIGRYGFSDVIPPLLGMEATLHFYHRGAISLEDYLDDKKKDRDLLLSVSINKQNGKGYFKKIAKTALDFSILNVCVTNANATIKMIVGSRPGLASMAKRAMGYLANESVLNHAAFEKAVEIALSELSFSDNFRATKEYREGLAKTYLLRGLKEVILNESQI